MTSAKYYLIYTFHLLYWFIISLCLLFVDKNEEKVIVFGKNKMNGKNKI